MYIDLESDRLLIRPISLADADFMCALVNSEGWLRFIGDRDIHNSLEARSYIQRILDNDQFFYSVFEIKATGQPAGIVSFLYRAEQDFPDIGFAMLPAFENKGYAFEAAQTYLDEVLRRKLAPKIIALTDSENVSSIRLLQKLGLRYESSATTEERTTDLYTLIAD